MNTFALSHSFKLRPLLLSLLFIVLQGMAIFAQAESTLDTSNTSDLSLTADDLSSNGLSQNTFDSFSSGEEFLHVDEAYKLSVSQTADAVIAEWMIADAYFLYGEQFRFSTNDKPVTATRPKGKISYDEIFEKDVEKYYVYIKTKISKDQLPQNEDFSLSITSQGCADAGLCYPPETKVYTVNLVKNSFELNTQPNNTSPINQTPRATPNTSLLLFIIMVCSALAGGLILNLMPCVFPVLSIKALSLANNHNHKLRIQHGWSYTLGCLVTFIIIAGILLIVRDAGKAVGWGFQLQSPLVVSLLAFLFFVMGLSLSGLFTFGTRWMNTGQSLTEGKGIKQSFFTGILSAIVASPCTAPFMAGVLGYALVQPTLIALSIFIALGFGMALPFLLLSYLPKLGQYLPKPGAWMDTFKQALAFPLYLTSIWLLWVLGHQIGSDGIIWVIIGAIFIIFTLWLSKKKPSWSSILIILSAIIITMISWNNHQRPTIDNISTDNGLWETYTQEKLYTLRQQGKPVFINLTADWCITCKVNEKLVFTTSTLQWMKDQDIHLLEGDWTNYNANITQLLDSYGRGGVPLYLLFPANSSKDAQILPQILNPATFKQKINSILADNNEI